MLRYVLTLLVHNCFCIYVRISEHNPMYMYRCILVTTSGVQILVCCINLSFSCSVCVCVCCPLSPILLIVYTYVYHCLGSDGVPVHISCSGADIPFWSRCLALGLCSCTLLSIHNPNDVCVCVCMCLNVYVHTCEWVYLMSLTSFTPLPLTSDPCSTSLPLCHCFQTLALGLDIPPS